MATLYVQYGCGQSCPDGWLNFDASPALRLQRIPGLGFIGRRVGYVFHKKARFGDIRFGLPVPQGSCDGVYCSHTLEHLALNDCRLALANTMKILKPGGRFRLVMPDLQDLVAQYTARQDDPGAARQFMLETMLGEENRKSGLMNQIRNWIGNSAHLWLWDYVSIAHELKLAGFTGIRRASFNDSGDARFAEVEELDRWEKHLGVECFRPPA